MQSAETVLGVLRDRGRRGLPCNELYRQLFNPAMYLLAYGRLYSNQGAMTPGVDGETADGMSMARIGRIIDALRHERYRFRPVKRVYIPKRNGKRRPLGLPSWSDKLVSEVVRLLLEAYYEPQFSDRSHGFQCFDRLDHSVMMGILGEKVHDNRFLRLLRNMLQAGYLEDWEWNATLSGAPQGGVASPILSNIYLDEVDKFVERELIPQYTRGAQRKPNRIYEEVSNAHRRAWRRGDRTAARQLRKQRRRLPSGDPRDPDYRRLRYVRYADDQLLGFIGPKAEAEEIKARLTTFLRDTLKLELSWTRR
jgi:retron-type reverse transcriptase